MNNITFYILLFVIILSIISIFSFLIYKVHAYGERIQKIEIENKTLQDKLIKNNGSRSFRLSLKSPVECFYTITKIDGIRLDVNKEVEGRVINISRTGLLFKTNLNYPLDKKDILMKFKFKIDKVNFDLTGRLVRKEIRFNSENVYYGVEFEGVPSSINRSLTVAINRIDAAQRREKIQLKSVIN